MWRWAEAEAEYKRAISLNPNYPTTYLRSSRHLRIKRQSAVDFLSRTSGDTLNGEKFVQITAFKSERIWNFAYSRAGKLLALARGEMTRDVVLISDMR